MENENKMWFPAKRYGWGWGLPCAWQGWIVLTAYVALTIATVVFINPVSHIGLFLTTIYGLSMALVLVCWLKGEKPSWRWGDKK